VNRVITPERSAELQQGLYNESLERSLLDFAVRLNNVYSWSKLVAEVSGTLKQLLEADEVLVSRIERQTGMLCLGETPSEGLRDFAESILRGAGNRGEDAIFKSQEYCGVLLLGSGDVLGVLVTSRAKRAWDETCSWVLKYMGAFISNHLVRDQSEEELRSRETELLHHNQDLEEKISKRTEFVVRAKKEWETTFDSIREPILLMDGSRVVRANLAYANWIGKPITSVPGGSCCVQLFGSEAACLICPALTQGVPQGTIQTLNLPTGRIVEWAWHPMILDGKEGFRVLQLRDVTDYRRSLERLQSAQRMAAAGQLANGAAHEINNPLAFVIANVQFLQSRLSNRRTKY
jgi:hypothetical protein